MINMDEHHMKNLRINTSKRTLALLLSTGSFLLSGCGKTIHCDIKTPHAHAYTNEDGIIRHIQSEKERYDGYNRLDSYTVLDEEEQALNNFEAKKHLIIIDENTDKLMEIATNNRDCYIYEYTYQEYESHRMGVHCYHTWEEETGWAQNPNDIEIYGEYRNLTLTGNTLVVHYVYPTYKIIVNEKDKYELIEGPILDSFEDATTEYPYIKTNYETIIYLEEEKLKSEKMKQQKLVK